MIEPVAMKLIWVGVALMAYGLFRWRWLIAMQDIVVGAVQDAERWERAPQTSAPAIDLIRRLRNAAYRPFTTCCIAVVVSVGVVVGAARDLGRKPAVPAQAGATGVVNEEAQVISRLLVAVLATSPIALVLVTAFICLGSLLRGSAKAVIASIPEASTIGGPLHQSST